MRGPNPHIKRELLRARNSLLNHLVAHVVEGLDDQARGSQASAEHATGDRIGTA